VKRTRFWAIRLRGARYDARPGGRCDTLLAQASAAVEAKDYHAAQRYCEAALTEAPERYAAHDLLGICYLYRQQPEKAITVYETLIARGVENATMRGHAAQAYAMAKRYDDAERELRAAMRLGGTWAQMYGIRLVDVVVLAGNLRRADAVAQDLAAQWAPDSIEAIEFQCKRIEIAYQAGETERVPELLDAITEALTEEDEEPRREAFFSLYSLAGQFLYARAFDVALMIARRARAVDSTDPAIHTLEQALQLLSRHDADGVARLLETDIDPGLRSWVEEAVRGERR
jgi:tetratricopeptide (TPR) repeat protein